MSAPIELTPEIKRAIEEMRAHPAATVKPDDRAYLYDADAWDAAMATLGLMREQAERAEAALSRLTGAVSAVYYAAHWTPDRDVDAAALWTDLRNAAGFEPGNAPRAGGER